MTLPAELRKLVGNAVLKKVQDQGHRLVALAVVGNYAHLLVELPRGDKKLTNRLVGQWKQAASHAVRAKLPGKIWAAGCHAVVVKDRNHHREVFRYILAHAAQDGWVWFYKQAGTEESPDD